MHNRSANRRGEKGGKNIFEEIMANNFPNLMKCISLHIQEPQQTPSWVDTKRSTSKYVTVKRENLKASREN